MSELYSEYCYVDRSDCRKPDALWEDCDCTQDTGCQVVCSPDAVSVPATGDWLVRDGDVTQVHRVIVETTGTWLVVDGVVKRVTSVTPSGPPAVCAYIELEDDE